ncbi:ABC transporter substrate-binding protein [Saccharolobus solfataricus]|uniref:ABC transporter substrate-binding protein n=2 Tax=Saccharolobus solfataricus TaxID=2287 RepID=A0A0E3KCE0_SACSO|nr:ABC transporter substrate-binding protein [Saccharolobus solfataricus]AKA73780.1 ABC transporter substrate-binding protein [Saccharolobus solfataricus]AKA76477.1 ABC transporter substrate-binding protein [Saccharolobus solfataricus]AKA79170.1 ABC transporter substrate-binding protein [Saccharolobus solfataricus]AZF68255.1 ABC transporter substrate-binding protein [Saccharolobus solfataricus]AZF70875.1 ABC transporter substrate-binding protein [Saccharolobus solfataricus]
MSNVKIIGTIVAIIIVVGVISVYYYYKSSSISQPLIPNNNLRVVSLAPSDTQILISLGLGKYIVGIDYYSYQLLQSLNLTKYIPSNVMILSQISPPNISGLLLLHPTVVVVEEGLIGSYLQQMKEAGLNVFITNNDFASSYSQIENCILKIGEYFNVTGKAQQLIDWMNQKISDFSSTGNVSVAYLLWICPDLSFYTAGGNVFINSIIVQAGGINVFANYSGYPLLTPSPLLVAKPSIIIAQEEYNLTYTDYLLSQYKGINSNNTYVMGELATNLFNEPGPLSVYSIQMVKLIIEGKAPHFISDNWVINNLNVTLPVF